MEHWVSLLRLTWLTGADGRISFWKVVVTTCGCFLVGLTILAYLVGEFLTALPWLVTLAVFLVFAAFGLKGVQAWAIKSSGPHADDAVEPPLPPSAG